MPIATAVSFGTFWTSQVLEIFRSLKFDILILSGSITAIRLSAVLFSSSRTQCSNIAGSTQVVNLRSSWNLPRVQSAPVTPTRPQKLLIACGGKPRRRRAVRVKRRGSSQSQTRPESISAWIFRFEHLTVFDMQVTVVLQSYNRVVDVESAIFPLNGAVHVHGVAEPEVRRASRLKLFCAKWMRNVLDGIAQAVREVVSRIDAPFFAGSMMRSKLYSVRDGIFLSVFHHMFHTQSGSSFFDLSVFHVSEKCKWFFYRTFSPGRVRGILIVFCKQNKLFQAFQSLSYRFLWARRPSCGIHMQDLPL